MRQFGDRVRIDLVAYEGLDELDLIGPLEVFRRAQAAGATTQARIVAETLAPIRCAHGLLLYPDALPSDADAVVVPGGGWLAPEPAGVRLQVARDYWPAMIAQAHDRGSLIMSVCTGAMLLAQAGILAGRRATTHWSATADLAAFDVTLLAARVVDDGDIITAGGVTCGIDLALWAVTRLTGGSQAAKTIAESLVYSWDESAVARPLTQAGWTDSGR